MFTRCPHCKRFHIITPKICKCGYDFVAKQLPMTCPNDGTPLTFDLRACPKCKTDINDLFRYPCPHCGKYVGVNWESCQFCGEQLLHRVFRCPRCRKDVTEGAAVCPHCGRNFFAEYSSCPRCEREVELGAHVCPHCGLNFSQVYCGTCGSPLASLSSPCYVCGSWTEY